MAKYSDMANNNKKIFIGLDFDCTFTQFHYYWTYNWDDVDARYLVNDDRLKNYYRYMISQLLKSGNFSNLHQLMTSNNVALKQDFVRLLFGNNFEYIVKMLYSIKAHLKDEYSIDVDYYIISLGRIETLALLFNVMDGMNKYYKGFTKLFKSVFVTNSSVPPFTDHLGECYYDTQFRKIGCIGSKNSQPLGKDGFINKLFNDGYDYGFMIDDSAVMFDNTYKFKNIYTYIQPGNLYTDTFNDKLKNNGGRYLTDTIKNVLIPSIKHVIIL